MSSAVEATLRGTEAAVPSRMRFTRSSGIALPNHGVSMKPGQMALTRILGASERASESVMVVMAPFDAA